LCTAVFAARQNWGVEPVAWSAMADPDPVPADELVELRLRDLPNDGLESVYARLLIPAFRSDELITLDEMRTAYTASRDDPSCVLVRMGRPIAVMLGEWYADHSVLLLAYLAVAREARGAGAGTRLVQSILPRWYADVPEALVLAEVDDPGAWPEHPDTGDPQARLRFYERHGARLLPMRYFQPSLRAGSPRVKGMFLLRLDNSPGVSSDLLTNFLTEYFTICEGPSAIQDPEVADLLSNAAAIDPNKDPWPVSRWVELSTSG
jgi:GNAT superfamily N-acetyltransferase